MNVQQTLDYIFYGDSFNAQYNHYIQNRNEYTAITYHPECLSTPNLYSFAESCKEQYTSLKNKITTNPTKNLVIAQAWSWALEGLKDKTTNEKLNYSIDEFLITFKNELDLMKKDLNLEKIILIGINNHYKGPSPEKCIANKFNQTLYEKYVAPSGCIDVAPLTNTDYVENFNHKIEELAKAIDYVYFINPNDAVCRDDQCIQIKNNLSLYNDGAHFSVIGSNIVGKFILNKLNKITNTNTK